MSIYYQDDQVTLYLGDCREETAWLDADVLCTDPPYGIGWKRGAKAGMHVDRGHAGIANDTDTAARDGALTLWGERPGLVFGSFYAPAPTTASQWLIFKKWINSGVVGSVTGWRRDVEPIFVVGDWPKRPAKWSSVIETSGGVGNIHAPQRQTGHPHAKPQDVMQTLIERCPPGVIADPFAGSGSTLVAAKALGRRSIGVELEERYCEIAAKRLAQDALPLWDLA